MLFIQHGGEYGYVRTSVAYPLVEYCQHRFITWGWKRHGLMPGNFLPLPHPQLAALRDAHREKSPTLLLVGTEMALLPYTLKSMLRGGSNSPTGKTRPASWPPCPKRSASSPSTDPISTSLPRLRTPRGCSGGSPR